MFRRRALVGWYASAALLSLTASAEASDERVELHGDTAFDLFLVGSNLYLAMLLEFSLNTKFVPTECRWCDPPGFDADLHEALEWRNPRTARTLSDIVSYGVAPLEGLTLPALAAAYDNRSQEIAEDLLYVGEATTTAIVLQLSLKGIGGKPPPALLFPTDQPNPPEPRPQHGPLFPPPPPTHLSLAGS